MHESRPNAAWPAARSPPCTHSDFCSSLALRADVTLHRALVADGLCHGLALGRRVLAHGLGQLAEVDLLDDDAIIRALADGLVAADLGSCDEACILVLPRVGDAFACHARVVLLAEDVNASQAPANEAVASRPGETIEAAPQPPQAAKRQLPQLFRHSGVNIARAVLEIPRRARHPVGGRNGHRHVAPSEQLNARGFHCFIISNRGGSIYRSVRIYI